eukprot:1327093-Amorphochlora_amoeboformis.AAC.2
MDCSATSPAIARVPLAVRLAPALTARRAASGKERESDGGEGDSEGFKGIASEREMGERKKEKSVREMGEREKEEIEVEEEMEREEAERGN